MSRTERVKSRPGEMRAAWTHPSERGRRILQIAPDSTEDPAVGFKYDNMALLLLQFLIFKTYYFLFFKIDHFFIPTSMLKIAKYQKKTLIYI